MPLPYPTEGGTSSCRAAGERGPGSSGMRVREKPKGVLPEPAKRKAPGESRAMRQREKLMRWASIIPRIVHW